MKIIDFINDYSAVIAIGLITVALIAFIIFKAIEIHKLNNIKNIFLEDIRRCTRFLGDIYYNIESIHQILGKANFISSINKLCDNTDAINGTLETIHSRVYETNDLIIRRADWLSEFHQDIKCLIEQATYIEENIEKTAKELKKIRKEGQQG